MGDILTEAVNISFRNNLLNLYHDNERTGRNPNRIPLSQLRTTLSSRYYNTPPIGGYQINEEHDYVIDPDDLSALIFLDITTKFASVDKNLRKTKIKQIKYKKAKIQTENVCPICLDHIVIGEFQKTLECKHCFHKKCIDHWFKKDHNECPMCRKIVINI